MALVKSPRTAFIDFPLGRQCGKPNDMSLQIRILKDALETLVKADVPGKIVDLPYEWGDPFDWESYQRDVEEMIKEEDSDMQEWVPKK